MIRLIASDLDGTLLNSESEISEYSKEILTEAIERGIIFVPCSGRSANNIILKTKEIPGIRYVVGANGTGVFDLKENAVVYSNCLDQDVVLQIYDFIIEHNGFAEMYDATGSYMEAGTQDIFYRSGMERVFCDSILEATIRVPDLREALVSGQIKTTKIHICFPKNDWMYELEKLCRKRDDLSVAYPTYHNMEIFPADSDKDKSIAIIAEKEGIDQSQIMAIGDSTNDIAMIRYAGTGVAVGNAMPAVKDAADIISASNDEDGPAKEIKKILDFL